MLTCAICQKQVIPTKPFAVGWFLFWILFTGVGALGYLIYFAARASVQCPVCRNDVYGRVKILGGLYANPSEAPPSPSLAERRQAQRAARIKPF